MHLVLLLCLSMIVFSGLYIALVMIRFLYVTPMYMAISVILAIIYMIYAFRNAKLKLNMQNEEHKATVEEKAQIEHNETVLKALLILFLPVLVTLLCDYVYLSYLADSSFFKNLTAQLQKK